MSAPIEERLSLIKERFISEEYELLEISGSFRVSLETGQNVYIYSETSDNSISVRIETTEADAELRAIEMRRLREKLEDLISFARISEFQLSQAFKAKWAYTARMEVTEAEKTSWPAEQFSGVINSGCPTESSAAQPLEVFEKASELNDAPKPISIEELMELLGMLELSRLEQMLDWMYIDPSSKLRTAFNELFRSKMDSAKLSATLEAQARKFSERADIEELEMIRHINTDIVIQPIINLLCHTVYIVNGMDRPDFNWGKLSR